MVPYFTIRIQVPWGRAGQFVDISFVSTWNGLGIVFSDGNTWTKK